MRVIGFFTAYFGALWFAGIISTGVDYSYLIPAGLISFAGIMFMIIQIRIDTMKDKQGGDTGCHRI